MAGFVNWGPFVISRFLHAVAGAGHPLSGIADVADDGGASVWLKRAGGSTLVISNPNTSAIISDVC